MKKVKLGDVEEYEAPGHFKMTAMRLHGKEETGTENFWVGLSHFLPGGGAEMSSSDFEKVYFVLSGRLVVETDEGEEITLKKNDSLYIPPGEKRYLENKEKGPASMLVIASY